MSKIEVLLTSSTRKDPALERVMGVLAALLSPALEGGLVEASEALKAILQFSAAVDKAVRLQVGETMYYRSIRESEGNNTWS